ncbi:unnamed protein product, partial [Ectocarpus sp. 6 AP-2014]
MVVFIDGEDPLVTMCYTTIPVTPPPQGLRQILTLMNTFCSQRRSMKVTEDVRYTGPADNVLRVVAGKGLWKTMCRAGDLGSPFLILRQTASRHLICRMGIEKVMAHSCRSSLTRIHGRVGDVYVEESLKTFYHTAVPSSPLPKMSMCLIWKHHMVTNRSQGLFQTMTVNVAVGIGKHSQRMICPAA